jgi:hypothetical protein
MEAEQIDRLARLNELRAAGALTEDEFAAEKSRLLSGKKGRSRLPFALGLTGIIGAAFGGAWLLKEQPAPQEAPKAATSAVPSPSASRASVSVPSTAERARRAFRAATGHSAPFDEVVKGEAYTVSPSGIFDLPFGPVLVLKREMKDGCHSCTGFLGIYYLREDQAVTTVTASYPEAVAGWGWGAAPSDWELTTRFAKFPTIYASGGYTGQGVTISSAVITELQPEGPVASELIGLGYSDAGAITDDDPRPVCELEGKITNVERDRGFDVVVTGTLSGRDRYVKRGGKFVPVKKRDWELPCSSS